MTVHYRKGGTADAAALADVYRDAVMTTGGLFYDAAQIAAWAAFPESMGNFAIELGQGIVIVAEEAGEMVAFGQLDPADRIAFLYCRGSHGRRGIATGIYQQLEAAALGSGQSRLVTEASRASRPLFEKLGFETYRREEVERNGAVFERFRMRKALAGR